MITLDGRKNLAFDRLGWSLATGTSGSLVDYLSMFSTPGQRHVVTFKGMIETHGLNHDRNHDRVVVKEWSNELALEGTYPPPA